MSRQKGLFFDYDNQKYISTPDKLDDETRQSIIEKLERNGFEYNEGDYKMLYEVDEEDNDELLGSVIFNDDNTVTVLDGKGNFVKRMDLTPDEPVEGDIFEIMKDLDVCDDIVVDTPPQSAGAYSYDTIKKVKISHLLHEELRMPKDVIKYVEFKLSGYREYTTCDSIIKQIWYDVKYNEEVAKKFMTAFITIAVYNYYACLPVKYEDMTNDVMKLNREVMTNHKLDLMIIDILQRYPQEYDRAVIKFMEHFDYCGLYYSRIKGVFAGKREVLELLKNKYL